MIKLDDDTLRISIFPTLVYVIDLSNLTNELVDLCEDSDWNDEHNYHCKNLYVLDSHQELKKKFEDKVNYVLNSQFKYETSFQITTSWLTRTRPYGSIQKHKHTNSLWSTVFYFYDGCGSITFHKERPAINVPTSKEFTDPDLGMHGDIVFLAEKGKMLLFPSSLDHSVSLNDSDKYRYSIAMNWMPQGMCKVGDSSFNYK